MVDKLIDKTAYRLSEIANYCNIPINDILHFAKEGEIDLYVKAHGAVTLPLNISSEKNQIYLEGFLKLSRKEIIELKQWANIERLTFCYSELFESALRTGNDALDPDSLLEPIKKETLKNEFLSSALLGQGCYSIGDVRILKESLHTIVAVLEASICPDDILKNKKLPKELNIAIQVYEEFWEDKPLDCKPAEVSTIKDFIQHRLGDDSSRATVNRILLIARPQNEKRGGATNPEYPVYQGRSKDKTY